MNMDAAPLPVRAGPDAEERMTLEVLAAVENDRTLTQRRLSVNLGIALGLANGLLKRCVRKGLIKIAQAPANRYAYYLTPQGFAEKSRLTADFLSNSFALLRVARREFADLYGQCHARGWTRVLLCGAGDLADIAQLARSDRDIHIVGVVDPDPRATAELPLFAGLDAAGLPAFDAVIVTTLRTPQQTYDALRRQFPAERVLAPPFMHISTRQPVLME